MPPRDVYRYRNIVEVTILDRKGTTMQEDTIIQGIPILTGILFLIIAFVALLASALQVLVFCKICSKAGFHWALGLLILLPVANIGLPIYLAFADWPVRRELRQQSQLSG